MRERTTTIYEAFDGKEFLTYEECEEYEHKQATKIGLHLWDENRQPTDKVWQACYVQCDTEEAADRLIEYCDDAGCAYPWDDCPKADKVGFFYWDFAGSGAWHSWTKTKEMIEDLAQYFQLF